MNRSHLSAVAGAGSGILLGLLLAFQAGAQGPPAGAKPPGTPRGGMNAGRLTNGWPRAPEVQPPSRLPHDKTFGEKGSDASANKAANASSEAAESAAAVGCAKAKAAIASAGTGGSTGKGQGGAAGAEGRAKAAEAVCSGASAEESADAIQATEVPGHIGVTGIGQATLRADEHAEAGLEKAQSNQESDDTSDLRKEPGHGPPQQ